MAERITRKQLKHDDFVEAAFDFEQWVEGHWRLVGAIVGGVALLALLGYGFGWWRHRQETQSAERLGAALLKATGDPTNPSAPAGDWAAALPAFEDVAKSGSAAGRTAEYYRGVALANSGRAAEAIPVLESVASGTGTLADLARAKLAWALAAGGQTDRAVEIWKAFAANEKGTIPTDMALFNEASVLASAGKNEEAKTVLADLMQRFPQSTTLTDARALQTALGGGNAAPQGAAGAR